ncbi:ComF family protein [Paenarthrobacter sp. NPDC092416]|uniref:ComF family protein n=1 Tax=Paenarthrobacter sp. NPDC092416 TaxID=3364386 RepID=UPI0038305282
MTPPEPGATTHQSLGRPPSLDPDLTARDPSAPGRRGEYASSMGRLLAGIHGMFMDLGKLAIPVDCVCCTAEDTTLCSVCSKRVRQLCRRPFRAEQQSPALVDVEGAVLLGVVAAGPYRDELAQCLLSFKRLGQWRLAAVLAPCLGGAILAATGGRQEYCLVPVPSSGKAFRARGFSPVHLLLACLRSRKMLPGCQVIDALEKAEPVLRGYINRAALRELGVRTLGVPVTQGTGVQSGGQKGLGRGERARRVRRSMRARRGWASKLRGRHCLIVDDVLTTGATLAEAARAVSEAGGIVCGAVVLAATRPPAYDDSDRLRDPGGGVKTQSKNK